MGYFSKRERNRRRNAPEIKKFNDRVEELVDMFNKASKENGFENSMLECSARGDMYHFSISNSYHSLYYCDKGEFAEIIKERYKSLSDAFENSMKLIDKYAPLIQRNKEENDKLFNDGVPLFITLVPIYEENFRVKYAFCYEFKKGKEDGNYIANLLFSYSSCPENMPIKPNNYLVRKMTEEEFENHYIMDRLEYNREDLKTEEDIVKFDNSIRQLFNGQY